MYPIDESYQNNQPFFEENKHQGKKFFLQNMVFLFYHRTSVPSLITLWFKKVLHEKKFPEKLVFPKKSPLSTFVFPEYHVDIYYQTVQKKFHFSKRFFVGKGPRISFFPIFRFLYSHWQQCPSKKFVMEGIFKWKFFLHYSL